MISLHPAASALINERAISQQRVSEDQHAAVVRNDFHGCILKYPTVIGSATPDRQRSLMECRTSPAVRHPRG